MIEYGYFDGAEAARHGKEASLPQAERAGPEHAWLRGYDSVKEGKNEHKDK